MRRGTAGTRLAGLTCYGFGLLSFGFIASIDSVSGVSLLVAAGLTLIVIGIRDVARS